MARDKLRIRFRKAGDLRLVSHHDLMRCFERMLRRAALPFHSTEGFNPKPRMVFAQSLGLGIVGGREVIEIELDEPIESAEAQTRLSAQAPAGLEILEVERINPRTRAHPISGVYCVAVPAEKIVGLAEKAANLLALANVWIERTRPNKRRIDIRPYLLDIRVLPEALEMHLLITPNGTARPDEIVTLLDLCDILAAGAVFERTDLLLAPDDAVAIPAAEHANTDLEPLAPDEQVQEIGSIHVEC